MNQDEANFIIDLDSRMYATIMTSQEECQRAQLDAALADADRWRMESKRTRRAFVMASAMAVFFWVAGCIGWWNWWMK